MQPDALNLLSLLVAELNLPDDVVIALALAHYAAQLKPVTKSLGPKLKCAAVRAYIEAKPSAPQMDCAIDLGVNISTVSRCSAAICRVNEYGPEAAPWAARPETKE